MLNRYEIYRKIERKKENKFPLYLNARTPTEMKRRQHLLDILRNIL